MIFLFLGCSDDTQIYRDNCQLEVSILNTETEDSSDTSSDTNTSPSIPVLYGGETLTLSVQPLTSLFDTLVTVNGQRLTTDETWFVERISCSACDSCKSLEGCSSCSDCDSCYTECFNCREELSFQIPMLQEDLYQIQVKNTFGEGPYMEIFIRSSETME